MNSENIAFENIDRVMSLELQGSALPYGVKAALYDAARTVHQLPLAKEAAMILNRAPCTIGIVTGAQVPDKMPLGENDGPLGSVILAKALKKLGHEIVFFTDIAAAEPIEKLLTWLNIEAELVRLGPSDIDIQKEAAKTLDVGISVERLGSNPNGILYGATGVSRSSFRCNTDTIFNTLAALGRPTIGIADGGNEIGCGKIRDIIIETLEKFNFADRTPCGGGIFSVVPTDVLVIATSSNLGCAGVTAALALLNEDSSLCHKESDERALIAKGVEFGLTDGGSGTVKAAVDGVPANVHASLVSIINAIVNRALTTTAERDF